MIAYNRAERSKRVAAYLACCYCFCWHKSYLACPRIPPSEQTTLTDIVSSAAIGEAANQQDDDLLWRTMPGLSTTKVCMDHVLGNALELDM